MSAKLQRIRVVDTHTGGEPTRLVLSGGPALGTGTMAERAAVFREQHGEFRSAVVNEPRGSNVLVGALLCPAAGPAATGVIFFNNVGTLGMCGHGSIGVAVALAHLGRLGAGTHFLETSVGSVAVTLDGPNHVSVENVRSYRLARGVAVDVPGLGTLHGDVAWGGNWFFLVDDHGQELTFRRVAELTEVTGRIKQALQQQHITGADGAEIDHIELYGPPSGPHADGKNFVLCPGNAYDRSPCGTGTSAKVACLVADGKLRAGETWRQESIVGSIFEVSAQIVEGLIYPRIRGSAYVTAEATLLLDPRDPFRTGLRP